MPDQSKLAEILCRMQSDFVLEHIAAADDFIKEGFPTNALFSIIQGFQQPNLVSMYFYISGKRNDEETIKAWIYLQRRFEADPNGFVANSYSPMLLSDENRYLLYSARKYLLIDGKFRLFRSYLEIIKQKAVPLMQEELSADKTAPAIVIFYQWLQNFFAVYTPNKTKSRELSSLQKGNKKVQVLEELHQAFQKMREMVTNFSFDQYIAEAEQISEYPNWMRYWEDRDAYNAVPHKYPAHMRYDRPFFPDVPCPYYDAVDNLSRLAWELPDNSPRDLIGALPEILNRSNNVSFRLEILNRVQNTVIAYQNSDWKIYRKELISTYLYLDFEQTFYDIGYDLQFYRIVVYEDTSFYESFLLPYLNKSAFFDFGSRREAQAYMAVDALLEAKSITAYSFVKKLLQSEQASQLKPPSSNYWEFGLNKFYKSLEAGGYVERPVYEIGLDWEDLCQRMAKTYFLDVLTNHEGICLENRTIPDIMVGKMQRNEQGRVSHVERIIECKKSLYFTGRLSNILNNETTYQYYDFCDVLEYWILEKGQYFPKDITGTKVKCVFSNDFLNEPWLSDDFKDAIRYLQREIELRDSQYMSKKKTIDELIDGIDNLIKCPPPNIIAPSFWQHKSKKRIKPTSVIRQYTMEGNFLKEFESVSTAASETGLRVDTITNATSGRRNSAGGYLWKKCPTGSPVENIVPPNTALDLVDKIIFQVDHYGEVVATFDTIGQAAKTTGISRRSISDVLKGIQKTAGGYAWLLNDAP